MSLGAPGGGRHGRRVEHGNLSGLPGVGRGDVTRVMDSQLGPRPPLDGAAEVFRVERDALVRLAYVLTGSREVAEDLVQDVWVKTHTKLPGADNPAAYLTRSLVNAANSWHRRRRREEAVTWATPVAVAGPEHDELWDAIGALPRRKRTVLVLRYYLDYSERETAEALGWRVGTVKSATHRALADLRRALET